MRTGRFTALAFAAVCVVTGCERYQYRPLDVEVTDGERPVSGAVVRTQYGKSVDYMFWPFWLPPRPDSQITDERGRATVSLTIDQRAWYEIYVTHPGFKEGTNSFSQVVRSEWFDPSKRRELRLILERGD